MGKTLFSLYTQKRKWSSHYLLTLTKNERNANTLINMPRNTVLNRLPNRVAPLIVTVFILAFTGCSEPPSIEPISARGANVILISVDTLRSDFITPYGAEIVDTPTVAALAKEGVLFEDALTTAPMTLPAHASMLTGLHPIQHGVRDNFNAILSDELVSVTERFRDAGYATAGVAGAIVLSRRTGIAQGFDHYDDEFEPRHFE